MAIGCPLSGLLANIYLNNVENKHYLIKIKKNIHVLRISGRHIYYILHHQQKTRHVTDISKQYITEVESSPKKQKYLIN